MSQPMVFELLARRPASPGTETRRAEPRSRKEAPARSFEDVLRGLDRTGRAAPRRAASPEPEEPARERQDEGQPEVVDQEPAAGVEGRKDGSPPAVPPAGTGEGQASEGETTRAVGADGAAAAAADAAATGVRREALLAVLAHMQGMALPEGLGGLPQVAPETAGAPAEAATPRATLPAERAAPAGPQPPPPATPVELGAVPAGPVAVAATGETRQAPAVLEAVPPAGPDAQAVLPDPAEAEPASVPAGRAPRSAEAAVDTLLQALAGKQGRGTGRETEGDPRRTEGRPSAAAPAGEVVTRAAARSAGTAQAVVARGATAPVGAEVPLTSPVSQAAAAGRDGEVRIEAQEGHQQAGPQGSRPATAAQATGAPSEVAPETSARVDVPLQPPAPAGTEGGEAATVQAAGGAATSPAEAAGPARGGEPLASMPLAQLSETVVKRLQQMRSPGSDEVRLELEPKELGALKIRLELRGDGVKAHFVVDRPVVQAMLERAMAELRQNLTQQGYRVDELQVALQGDGQARGQGGEPGGRPGRGHGRRVTGTEGVPPASEPARQAGWAGPGRIDIRA